MLRQVTEETAVMKNNLLSTKEVASYLNVNEKMVYSLVSEKGLPASKITGKWIFPQHLVDQWIEANTINSPAPASHLTPYNGLLIIAGSNDPLLEQVIGLFNARNQHHVAVFGNLGNTGGIRALKQNLCHAATRHLLQEDKEAYHFDVGDQSLDCDPVVVNFCRRRIGLVVAKGNPKGIHAVPDLAQAHIRIINRKLETTTRHFFDYKIKAANINVKKLNGYETEAACHMDVGLAVLKNKADTGPAIQPVADQLGLDFIPWCWECYDLLIPKQRFFDKSMQLFLSLLHESEFEQMASTMQGYDVALRGKIVLPQN